jgi:hypothetical protein
MNALIDDKIERNAQKLAYLTKVYPDHTLDQTISLFTQMAAVDVNAAIWAAQDLGYLKEPDPETKRAELLHPPKHWDLGETVEHLQDTILYCFRKMAQNETDMEEHALGTWTAGYPAFDVLIATRRLLDDRKLVEYTIDDWDKDGAKNTYKFFCLSENEGKMWGRKQFKEDPIKKGKPANAQEDELDEDPGPRSPREIAEENDERAEMQGDMLRDDED